MKSFTGFSCLFAIILVCMVITAGCQSRYEQLNMPALEEEQAGITLETSDTLEGSVELQSSRVEAEVTTAAASVFIDVDETVYVIGDSVNFRENYSLDSKVIDVLNRGTSAKRTGYSKSWSKVVHEGREGYIYSEYISGDRPEPDVKQQADIPEGSGRLIAIDAGHQSKGNPEKEPIGPGASEKKAKVASGTQGVTTGLPEYKLNLAVSIKLKAELEKRGYRVYMVRETDDVDISNAERAEMANKSGADILVRIHGNSLNDSTVHGTLTMCQTSKNPYNGDLYGKSSALSKNVVNGVSAATGFRNRGVQETDTMSGINWCKIPVTIVEMGFMSNEEEDRKMATEEYQTKLAAGIADGIDAYYAAGN